LIYKCSAIGLNIEIQHKLLNQLYIEGIRHFPNEFGGILIGRYSDNFKTCVIETTVLPIKYKSSRYSFERGNGGLMKKLKTFYKSEPSLIYVGEWHTHTDNTSTPSGIDKSAMRRIEEYLELGISSPLLLIIALNNNDSYKTGFYIQFHNILYKYETEN
jgi:integrative and conjugative element protein (TIGR02256 family)